jgi:hypothetical protein
MVQYSRFSELIKDEVYFIETVENCDGLDGYMMMENQRFVRILNFIVDGPTAKVVGVDVVDVETGEELIFMKDENSDDTKFEEAWHNGREWLSLSVVYDMEKQIIEANV